MKHTKLPTIPPLRPLGLDGRDLWDRVQAEYNIADVGGQALLQLAAEATDRLAVVRAGDPEMVHVPTELSLMAFITRTLQKLGLHLEPLRAGPGRPSTPTGVTWRQT